MKRAGYLYDKIIDKENIRKAIEKSSKGKLKRNYVKRVLANEEFCINSIYELLSSKELIKFNYKEVKIYDVLNKKERIISKPNYFPDQIIHYCIMNVLEPILLKKMYGYSCGSIPKRGTSFGSKNLRKWLDQDVKGTKYCLKMDVRKFYPSINNEILKLKFRNIIKDNDCLRLIDNVIDSIPRGIPLGNYTSGWFSNFFLNDLDYYIKNELKIKYYMRYVDDLVLLHGDKKRLHKVLELIKIFLKSEDLELKNNYQIFKIEDRGIDFLGFRFFREKTILRKRNMYRMTRKARKISSNQNISFKDACGMISYYGWIKNSDSHKFYNNKIKKYISIDNMKRIVSNYCKEKI
jgi:hypothetical protein